MAGQARALLRAGSGPLSVAATAAWTANPMELNRRYAVTVSRANPVSQRGPLITAGGGGNTERCSLKPKTTKLAVKDRRAAPNHVMPVASRIRSQQRRSL